METSIDEWQVRKLASLLASAGKSDLPILPYKGYIRNQGSEDSSRAFIYDYPKDAICIEIILSKDFLSADEPSTERSPSVRFAIAKSIANAIDTLHTDGWFHRSINGEYNDFSFETTNFWTH